MGCNQSRSISENIASGSYALRQLDDDAVVPQNQDSVQGRPRQDRNRGGLLESLPQRRADTERSMVTSVRSDPGVSSSSVTGRDAQPKFTKPTPIEIADCFKEVRAYYKGELKSENKFYGNTDSPKTEKRFINQNDAHFKLDKMGAPRDGGRTRIENGDYLIKNNIKYGNCGEMSDVAASIVRKKFPNSDLHKIIIGCEGSHVLIIVGSPPKPGDIASWGKYPSSLDSYVIDAWMGIQCHIKDYPSLAESKLNKWASQNKMITVPGSGSGRTYDFAFHEQTPNGIERHLTSHTVSNDPQFVHGFMHGTVKSEKISKKSFVRAKTTTNVKFRKAFGI
jgi:hypothetical protein